MYVSFFYACGCDLEKIVVALKDRKTLVQITSRRNQNLGGECWALLNIKQLVRTKGKHRSSRWLCWLGECRGRRGWQWCPKAHTWGHTRYIMGRGFCFHDYLTPLVKCALGHFGEDPCHRVCSFFDILSSQPHHLEREIRVVKVFQAVWETLSTPPHLKAISCKLAVEEDVHQPHLTKHVHQIQEFAEDELVDVNVLAEIKRLENN